MPNHFSHVARCPLRERRRNKAPRGSGPQGTKEVETQRAEPDFAVAWATEAKMPAPGTPAAGLDFGLSAQSKGLAGSRNRYLAA